MISRSEGTLLAELNNDVREPRHRCTHSRPAHRERFLPFPGWTLPNVMGAGWSAIVASRPACLSKRKKIVVAGSASTLVGRR